MSKSGIDVTFDFTNDTPDYWENFWERNDGLGAGGNDPDACSKTLQQYHQILWSKQLPNGEKMELSCGHGAEYLTWNGFRFGSDSITASFRYHCCKDLLKQVEKELPDYKAFMEQYLRKAYTIGGTIIFPKRKGSINQARGCHTQIRDRWDLTLECIRRYYQGQESPLYDTLALDKAFFALFGDFKGYVDFFYLQDCVSADYATVNIWMGEGDFLSDPLPKTTNEYFDWIHQNLAFVEKRNQRIQDEIK